MRGGRGYLMDNYELHQGDCLEIMKTMEVGSVDCVIADPPYFRIANEDWDAQWKDIYDWASWCNDWGKLACNVLSDIGSGYIFGDDKNIAYMQVELDKLNWGLINNIVWSKTNYTGLKADPMALRSYRVQAEERVLFYGRDITFPSFSQTITPIASRKMGDYLRGERQRAGVSMNEIQKLFPSATGGMTGAISNWELGYNFPLKEQYEKIRKYLNNGTVEYMAEEYEYMREEYEEMRAEYEEMRRPFYGNEHTDVWTGPAIGGAKKTHPSEKPKWIIERIVLASSKKGDTILDPFTGSGVTGEVCAQLGRKFVGIELDPDYFKIAEKRIQRAYAQELMF